MAAEPKASSPGNAWKRRLGLALLADHFPALHGVRVLAIFAVLQFHVTDALVLQEGLPLSGVFTTLSLTVFFGMDLFFVLSGFLIGTILMHSLSVDRKTNILRFYLRRSFRILPLYYVTILALAWMLPMTAGQKQNFWFELVYLTNWVETLDYETLVMFWGWSLAIEEQFYIAVPILIGGLYWVRSHRGRLLLLTGAWAAGTVVRLVIYHGQASWTLDEFLQAIYLRTHTRFDTLIAGILLAYVHFHFSDRVTGVFRRRGVRWSFAALSVLALVVLLSVELWRLYVGEHAYYTMLVFSFGTVTSIMYFCSILLLLNTESGLKRFLGARVFLYVATLGYGVYLWHIPVLHAAVIPWCKDLFEAGVPISWLWPIALVTMWVLAGVIAYVLHLVVEKPALLARDRLAPR